MKSLIDAAMDVASAARSVRVARLESEHGAPVDVSAMESAFELALDDYEEAEDSAPEPYIDQIQPTMTRVCALVNEIVGRLFMGLKTTDSGDGVTNVAAGMECALTKAHVVVPCPPEAALRVVERLGAGLRSRGVSLDDPESGASVEASWQFGCKAALVTVWNLTDADLP